MSQPSYFSPLIILYHLTILVPSAVARAAPIGANATADQLDCNDQSAVMCVSLIEVAAAVGSKGGVGGGGSGKTCWAASGGVAGVVRMQRSSLSI